MMAQGTPPILHAPVKCAVYTGSLMPRAWIESRRASPDPDVAQVAALIADPGRTAMLIALLDGQMLPASELAYRAGIAPNAASAHLGKLVAAGLLAMEPAGRQRLYRLATGDVGRAIEALATIARPAKIAALQQSRAAQQLRLARSCYDHLAGALGVGITDALIGRNVIEPVGGHDYRVTAAGMVHLRELGIEVDALRHQKRHLARQCLDWTERRPHVAGALGAAVRDLLLANGWIGRVKGNRSIRITADGQAALKQHFGLDLVPGPMAAR